MFGIEKVQIKKTDWHYRWLKFIHFIREEKQRDFNQSPYNDKQEYVGAPWVTVVHAPKSICPYFWLLMASFALGTIGLGGITVAAILVGWALILITLFLYGLVLLMSHHPIDAATDLLLAGGAIVIAYVFGKTLGYFIKIVTSRPYKEPKVKQPNTGLFYVVRTFAKAKKNKVCPALEILE